MERISVPPKTETELSNLLNGIMDAAAPLPLILDAAPTSGGGELKEGQIGIFGTSLFWTINSVTYSIPLTVT